MAIPLNYNPDHRVNGHKKYVVRREWQRELARILERIARREAPIQRIHITPDNHGLIWALLYVLHQSAFLQEAIDELAKTHILRRDDDPNQREDERFLKRLFRPERTTFL